MIMYTKCLFCHRDLGRNEAIEEFPVGRRLAYDPARGRLWVVCRRCERWNLSPLETRWEAIEACERRFRDTRLRVSTDNIGLARLPEGLELVRVGEPMRPEFAAWRYGDQFGKRRKRAIAYTAAGVTAGGAILVGGAAAGVSLGGGWWGLAHLFEHWRQERVAVRTWNEIGDPVRVQQKHLLTSRLYPEPGELGWALEVQHAAGWNRGRSKKIETMVIRDEPAIQLAGQLMARVNRAGGKKQTIQTAVARIEQAGDPERYLVSAATESERLFRTGLKPKSGFGGRYTSKAGSLRTVPADMRLALEMATQEQSERAALEGELAQLAAAWQHAEEIAEIADNLLIPKEIQDFVRREKRDPAAARLDEPVA